MIYSEVLGYKIAEINRNGILFGYAVYCNVNRYRNRAGVVYNVKTSRILCNRSAFCVDKFNCSAGNNIQLVMVNNNIFNITVSCHCNGFITVVNNNIFRAQSSYGCKIKFRRFGVGFNNLIFCKLRRIGLICRYVFNRKFCRITHLCIAVIPTVKGVAFVCSSGKCYISALGYFSAARNRAACFGIGCYGIRLRF